MANHFNDAEIKRLIELRKELPTRWEGRLRGLRLSKTLPQTRAHLVIQSDEGQFRISLRRNTLEREDFSVILAVLRSKENRWFRLRRYNGLHQSGVHKNRIEKTSICGFHVHTATLRYQRRGLEEDGYAERTDRYRDIWGALEVMIQECGFIKPERQESKHPNQLTFFRD